MILRDYQTRAIDLVRAEYRRGRKSVLLVLPTGAGKTATASQLIAWAVARGRRCLFVVHRREIVLDTARRLAAANVPCGVVMAAERPTDAAVQVCSVQTLTAREQHPPADLIVWDEAHHCAAETYRDIRAQYPTAWHLGLTATPERSDGAPLGDAFEALVAPITVAELVSAGHLAPIDVVAPSARLQSAIGAIERVKHAIGMGCDDGAGAEDRVQISQRGLRHEAQCARAAWLGQGRAGQRRRNCCGQK